MPPRNIHWPEELEIPAGFDDSEAPDALLCPITQELMRCPALLTVTGRTYELSAIKRWIGEHGTCPMDRTQRISEQDLAPNLGIRQLVESFVDDRSGGARAANTNLPACPPPAARPASPARLPPPPAQAEVPSQDAQAPDDPFTPNFDLPPPSSTAGIRVVDNKHPSGGEGCFFRFWADDLTSIVGAWAQARRRSTWLVLTRLLRGRLPPSPQIISVRCAPLTLPGAAGGRPGPHRTRQGGTGGSVPRGKPPDGQAQRGAGVGPDPPRGRRLRMLEPPRVRGARGLARG